MPSSTAPSQSSSVPSQGSAEGSASQAPPLQLWVPPQASSQVRTRSSSVAPSQSSSAPLQLSGVGVAAEQGPQTPLAPQLRVPSPQLVEQASRSPGEQAPASSSRRA